MTYLENSDFVELYSDLAEAILLEHHEGKIQLTQVEANGDERYTDEAQELFDGYCSLVLEVFESNGVKQRLTA